MITRYHLLLLVACVCGCLNGAFAQPDDSSVGARALLFSEDFSDNLLEWPIGSFGDGKAEGKISGGVYVLQSNQTGINWQIWRTVTLNPEKDFEIEARLRFVRGEDDNANCLFWGRNDDDHRYRFGFSGNGKYIIDKYDGEWTTFVGWTSSADVDPNGFNTLTVRKQAGSYSFYLNHRLVHTMPFADFFGQNIGFQVNQKTTLEIDDLRVTYLNLGPAAVYDAYPPESRQSLFSDEFDNNRWLWLVGTTSDGQSRGEIADGTYRWQSLTTGVHSLTTQRVMIDENSDFEIEASLRFVRGEDNNANCLIWGKDESGYRYRFGISGNGQYEIDRYDGNWTNFVRWTTAGSLLGNGFNTLTVRKVGNEFFFFVNRQLVHVMPFQRFYGPNLGFQVNQNTQIAIDDLHVWSLMSPTANRPPEIVITEPDPVRGMRPAAARSLRVAGRAIDPDGIREVTVNGMRAVVDNSGGFFITLPVTAVESQITVRATDRRGASSERLVSPGTPIVSDGGTERRIALLVGNAKYSQGGQLANPVNDVRAVKTALERLGFTVLKFENCSQADMKRAMDEFGRRLKDHDVALFFYAGHGLQVNGNNYLVPVDAALQSENDAEYDCVRADRVLAKMEAGGSKTNIVILDACRDNPFERSWHRGTRGSGLAFMNAPSGSLIAYSTSPGSVASDGSGANGTYTAALLEHVDTPGITILQMFQRVRSEVISRTNNQQIPWESTSLRGDFYFSR